MQGRNLGHVDDHVRVQHRHVGRLPQVVHEGFELRPGHGAELLVSAFAEPDQPGTQGVPAVGQLPDIAKSDQGAQQPVDGGQGKVGGGGEFTERDVPAGISDQFQQFKDALNGLNASGGFFSHSLLSATRFPTNLIRIVKKCLDSHDTAPGPRREHQFEGLYFH